MEDYFIDIENFDIKYAILSDKFEKFPKLKEVERYIHLLHEHEYNCFNYCEIRKVLNIIRDNKETMDSFEDRFIIRLIEEVNKANNTSRVTINLSDMLLILFNKYQGNFNMYYAKELKVLNSAIVRYNYYPTSPFYQDIYNYMKSIENTIYWEKEFHENILSHKYFLKDHDVYDFSYYVGAYIYYHHLNKEEGSYLIRHFITDYDRIIDFCILNGMNFNKNLITNRIDPFYYDFIINRLESTKFVYDDNKIK